MQLQTDSLKDIFCGDRVTLVGHGINETFQATAALGRCQYFISLQWGDEYTRPQLIQKYGAVGCEFKVARIPEGGW